MVAKPIDLRPKNLNFPKKRRIFRSAFQLAYKLYCWQILVKNNTSDAVEKAKLARQQKQLVLRSDTLNRGSFSQ